MQPRSRLRRHWSLAADALLRGAFVSLALFAVIAAGCSHYRLGTGSNPSFQSVFVQPVRIEALIPQAQALIGTQVREAFIRDGRVRLARSADEADTVLQLVIDGYSREVATVRGDDTGLARRFDVTLQARATLVDRRTGNRIFSDRPLKAQRGIFTDSGQTQAEYQNLVLLAEDIASRAVHATLDTW